MNPTHKLLLGLLVLQLGLAGITWSGRRSSGGPSGAEALLPVSLGDVTAFAVTSKPPDKDTPPEAVRLEKKGDAWVVASAGDYPAVTSKVEEVLKKVLELKVREPIATNKANHNALRVGERDFDRKLEVTAAGATTSLVAGSAKGTSIHVRKADSDAVYWARGVSTWNLSERVSSYVDTQYVSVEDPTKVTVTNSKGSFTLTKGAGGDWSVSGLPPGKQARQADLTAFVDKARKVTMSDPVGKKLEADYGLGDGARVVLEYKDGEATKTLGYSIGTEKDSKFYLKADEMEHVVMVSKWSVEKLVQQAAADFAEPDQS